MNFLKEEANMKTINDYLDTLFLNVPKTPATQKAKEDLLAIMEDHYYELLEEGKSENEAIGAVISEFGSIDELLAELEVEKKTEPDEAFQNAVQSDEALDFWDHQRNFAFILASGILLFFLALSVVVFADTGPVIAPLAIVSFFVLIALGVVLIANSTMKFSRLKKPLVDRPLTEETMQEASRQTLSYEKSFRVGLTLGIAFCILTIPLLLFFSEILQLTIVGVSIFFVSAGIGVFLIIYTSLIYNSFKKMSQKPYFSSDDEESGLHASKEMYGKNTPFVHFFRRLYWPCIVVLYFLISNLTESWGYSWLIFVFAGPVFSLIMEKNKYTKKGKR